MNGQLTQATKMAIAGGAKVIHAADATSALLILCSGKSVELLLVSEEINIKDLIQILKGQRISIPVVACGLGIDPDIAANTIKDGALDYLPLPPDEELMVKIIESVAQKNMQHHLIFQSQVMQEIMSIAKKVAISEASILITGGSGTGKEVIARFIHNHSKRSHNHMVAVNCASIPENLLESEMFGHEKGSFTGATERRIGKFEESNESTILLDEISEMDIKLQAKLLRVLQEREIVRIGSNTAIKLNVRVIATSNKDLQEAINQGTFREDLFYRLNVVNIQLPPLSERNEDIELLSNHFLEKYAALNGIPCKILGNDVLRKMREYSWPGNVRELENCMHRALLISYHEHIQWEDLRIPNIGSEKQIETLANMEKNAIFRAMHLYGYDNGRAAAALGVSIKLLQKKIKQLIL